MPDQRTSFAIIEPDARCGWTVVLPGSPPRDLRAHTLDLAESRARRELGRDLPLVRRDAYHRVIAR